MPRAASLFAILAAPSFGLACSATESEEKSELTPGGGAASAGGVFPGGAGGAISVSGTTAAGGS